MDYWRRLSRAGWRLISPLHYYVDASFDILLKGSGRRTLWQELLGIAVLSGVVFAARHVALPPSIAVINP